MCLSYYIVPIPLFFTLMTWTWCMIHLLVYNTNHIAPYKRHNKTKITSKTRYVKRKDKGRVMRWGAEFKISYRSKRAEDGYQRLTHGTTTTSFNAIGLTASHAPPAHAKLDSDSFIIAIDNCCSYSMTNNKTDFMGEITPCNVNIKGIGGNNQITECGTVCWIIADNKGKPHKIVMPGTYYNAKSPYWLWSPQHWAQTSANPEGTTCLTTHQNMTLHCQSMSFTRTAPLDQNTNCCFIRSVAGYNNHQVFMSLFPLSEEPRCFLRHYGLLAANTQQSFSTELPAGVSPYVPTPEFNEEQADSTDKMTCDSNELLRLHYRLGHLSFTKIRFMSTMGWIDSKLSKCEIPKCAGCLYGKASHGGQKQLPAAY